MKIVFSKRYLEHRHQGFHPESPERLISIEEALKKAGIWERNILKPNYAVKEDLLSVHTPEHVKKIKDFGVGWMDSDTYHDKETYEIALLAAGGAIEAVLYSFDHREPTVALLRPPGHHAGPNYNGGFCYFNNVATSTRKLQKERGVGRVAIVDIDVHHGNGTHDIFYSDKSVLYISTHQWGIYPGTGPVENIGEGEGEGYTMNLPLLSGRGDATFEVIMDEIIHPVLKKFNPEMILVSLGVDAHTMDPLASLTLSSPGYVYLTKRLYETSKEITGGRIAYMLEGGYHLGALAEVSLHTALNLEERQKGNPEYRYTKTSDKDPDSNTIKTFKEHFGGYWSI